MTVYSYEPHKLNEEQIRKKTKELDEFWEYVKVDLLTRLPLLRAELKDPTNPAFFFYDGSKLLLSLSPDPQDQRLALDSFFKADLQSVQHGDYLVTMHWLACKGHDIALAALRILEIPDFKAFIPQHALTLGHTYSLLYMLIPLDDRGWVPLVIQRVISEKDVLSQKVLLLILWYSMSQEGLSAIRDVSKNMNLPIESRSYAEGLLRRKSSILSYFSLTSTAQLKMERQKVMRRAISDEALIEFDRLTAKLWARQ